MKNEQENTSITRRSLNHLLTFLFQVYILWFDENRFEKSHRDLFDQNQEIIS